MALKNAQITALRTAIFANPTAAALLAAGNTTGLLAWCNADTATRRWLSAAPVIDVEEAPTYTGYGALTQGARDSWALFLKSPRDFGKNKVRTWVTSIWGAGTTGTNGEAVLLAGSAIATNAQVALGGNSRTTDAVTALANAYEEPITSLEIEQLVFRNNGQIWTAG